MNDQVKFIESVATPNDYIEKNVLPRQPLKRFRFKKPDLFDAVMIPLALCTAVSIGFLIYQLSKMGADFGQMAGIIGAFIG